MMQTLRKLARMEPPSKGVTDPLTKVRRAHEVQYSTDQTVQIRSQSVISDRTYDRRAHTLPLLPSFPLHFGPFKLQLAPCFDTPPADGGAGGGTGNGGGGGAPRTFTQEELDSIVADRLSRERKTIAKRYEDVDPEEFNRLKEEDRKRREQDALEKRNYEAALKSAEESWQGKEKKWKDTEGSLLGELKVERIRNRILQAAAASNAVDPGQVADLLEKRVRLGDDRQPIVLDEKGEPAFKEGKPLTVAALVSDYLDRYPNLVKPSGTEGAGAGGGRSTSGTENSGGRETPDLKTAREAYETAQAGLKGRHPSQGEMAGLMKLRRKYNDERKKAGLPALS